MIYRVVTAVGVLLAVGVLFGAAELGEKAKGPEFKTEVDFGGAKHEVKLVWGVLTTSSKVTLADEMGSEYKLKLDGTVEVPAELDAVAVFKAFSINRMNDAKGGQISVKQSPNADARAYDAYSAIHKQVGVVSLPELKLSQDATRIDTMNMETTLVIALKREEVVIPALVVPDYKQVNPNLQVRVSRMIIDASTKKLTITLEELRPNDGTTDPFVEQVEAIDQANVSIGKSRWWRGNPFTKKGEFVVDFQLAQGQVQKDLKLQIVTQSATQKIAFDVKGIFSRLDKATP